MFYFQHLKRSVGQQPNTMFKSQQQQPHTQQQQQQRDVIWEGQLHWKDTTTKVKTRDEMAEYSIRCSVTSDKDADGVQKVSSDNWPKKLIMQFIPKALLRIIGGSFLEESKAVLFHPEEESGMREELARTMGNDFAGCVHFVGAENCLFKVRMGHYTLHNYGILGQLVCKTNLKL